MTTRVLVGLLAALLLAGCGSEEGDDAASGGEIQVPLAEQSGSGQSGTATLTEVDASTTRVEIDIAPGQGGGSQPAHIHRGDCVNLNPQPEYGLESVRDGTSTSEVSAPIDELLGSAFAINVHKSDAEVQTYVACGEISSNPGAAETGTGETETETEAETETGETETDETETGETETGETETDGYGY